MKKYILILVCSLSVNMFSQEGIKADVLSEIAENDVSDLFTLSEFRIENSERVVGRPEPLGYIGENFQRFYIKFLSVIQNPEKPLEYFVYGKTRVKNNICPFQGRIVIDKAIVFSGGEFPSIDNGAISGTYLFYEDSDYSGTGYFEGNFGSFFYFNKDGDIVYDALMWGIDGYENNQFEGTWTSYHSDNSKKCNWGDFRIPNSRDLDSGAGEFGPSEKYSEFGWESYRLAYIYSSNYPGVEEARKKEKEKWWIDYE